MTYHYSYFTSLCLAVNCCLCLVWLVLDSWLIFTAAFLLLLVGIPSLIVVEHTVRERVKRAEEEYYAAIGLPVPGSLEANSKVLDPTSGERTIRINSVTMASDDAAGGGAEKLRVGYTPPNIPGDESKTGEAASGEGQQQQQEGQHKKEGPGCFESGGCLGCHSAAPSSAGGEKLGLWARLEGAVVTGAYRLGLVVVVPAPAGLAPSSGLARAATLGPAAFSSSSPGLKSISESSAAVSAQPDADIDCRVCSFEDEQGDGDEA